MSSTHEELADQEAFPQHECGLFGVFGHAANNLVEDVPLDHESRTSTATLAVVEEDGIGCARNGGIEVARVLEDDVGRFPAEFEADLLQVARGGGDDPPWQGK